MSRLLTLFGSVLLLASCRTVGARDGLDSIRSGTSGPLLDFSGVAPAPRGYRNGVSFGVAYALGRLRLIPGDPPQELPAGVREELDVVYASPGGRELRLDLYIPAAASPAPGILFVHGGSWKKGDRRDVRYFAVRYASRGYVTAAVEYRLSREATFPAALEDVRCAIRYLRAHAAQLGLREEAIAVLGYSAGGHLALLAAYAPEGEAGGPEAEAGPWSGVSASVAAVVDFYGPTDLTAPFVSLHPVVRAFMGAAYGKEPERYAAASPIRFVRAGAPPTLIFHGSIDGTVPVGQSKALFAALEAAGVPACFDLVEGWPHAMDAEERVSRHCAEVMDVFLDGLLRPAR